ncbi:MAG: tetratricopeptide repeat protein [Sphingobacteriia bacterium]
MNYKTDNRPYTPQVQGGGETTLPHVHCFLCYIAAGMHITFIFLIEAGPTGIILMAGISVVILWIAYKRLVKRSGEADRVRDLMETIAGKRYDEAIQKAKEIEINFPLFQFVRDTRLSLMIANGQPKAALEEIDQILQRQPGLQAYRMLRMQAMLQMGDLKRAYESLEGVRKGLRDPFYTELMGGILEIEQGKAEQGKERIRKQLTEVARKNRPPEARNPFMPSGRQKQPKKVSDAYERIIRVAPFSDPMLNVNVGLAYLYIGEAEWALQIWEAIIKQDEMGIAKATAQEHMAYYYYEQQQYGQALDYVHQTLFLLPKRGSAHYLLYRIHSKLGNPDNAEVALEQARKLQYLPALEVNA